MATFAAVLRTLLNTRVYHESWHAVASRLKPDRGVPLTPAKPARSDWESWARHGGHLPRWLGGEPTLPNFDESWDSAHNLTFLTVTGLYYYFKLTFGRQLINRAEAMLHPAPLGRLLANGRPDIRPHPPMPLEPPLELPGPEPFWPGRPVPIDPVLYPFVPNLAPPEAAPAAPWMEPLLEPLLPRPVAGGPALPAAAELPFWVEYLPALELL